MALELNRCSDYFLVFRILKIKGTHVGRHFNTFNRSRLYEEELPLDKTVPFFVTLHGSRVSQQTINI